MKVLFCLLLLAAVAHQGMTVDNCFNCIGNKDSGCADPFESTVQQPCVVGIKASCVKYIVETQGISTWTRACGAKTDDEFCNEMKTMVELGGLSTLSDCVTCETDLCNGSAQITASALSLFALAVLGRLLFA